MLDTIIMALKSRIRSKAFWAGILSLILMYAGNAGLYAKLGITQDNAQATVDTILTVLAGVGVFTNTDKLSKK